MVRLRDGYTKPPGHLTESDLINMMEANKIGTDASIATHINNVVQRRYVKLEAGRTMVPTDLGTMLVRGYFTIDPDLVLPKVRSSIEEQCDLIAAGSADRAAVVEHYLIQLLKLSTPT